MTFIQNKYTRWYYDIIDRAATRKLSVDVYKEIHHVIPRCLGGSDNTDNLVDLTAREHFICHWLLTKMVANKKEKYQMWNAFSCMLYREKPGQERYKVSSKVFDSIKSAGSKIKSERFKGENNPMYGLRGKDHPAFGKIWSEEHRKNASASHKGILRSAEARKKQSIATRGRTQTAEHVAKRICAGEKNGMYGKKLTPEMIARRTATLKANKLAKKLAIGV
jgi:hypothetical protein